MVGAISVVALTGCCQKAAESFGEALGESLEEAVDSLEAGLEEVSDSLGAEIEEIEGAMEGGEETEDEAPTVK